MPRTTLARFAFQNREVRLGKPVHPCLFRPPANGRLSVSFIDGNTNQEITETGKDVGQRRADNENQTKTLYGWARLNRTAFTDLGLVLNPDNSHVNVEGWPNNRLDKLDRAQKIARKSEPNRLTEPITIHPSEAPGNRHHRRARRRRTRTPLTGSDSSGRDSPAQGSLQRWQRVAAGRCYFRM